jgi:hypothetical protein
MHVRHVSLIDRRLADISTRTERLRAVASRSDAAGPEEAPRRRVDGSPQTTTLFSEPSERFGVGRSIRSSGAITQTSAESESRMSYTLGKAEEMARALRTLPAMDEAKRRLSKQAVVKHLVAEIAALQQRGYTIEQVVESLQGVGLTITTPTLKTLTSRKP